MLFDLGLVMLVITAMLIVAVDAEPVRPFAVLLAACLVPGGALMTRLRTGDGLTDLALAVGVSFAIDIALSLTLVWSGWWHPEAAGFALGLASLIVLAQDILRGAPR